MIESIENEEDYQNAMEHVDWLMEFDPSPDSVIGDELIALVTLVEEYEKSHSSNSLV